MYSDWRGHTNHQQLIGHILILYDFIAPHPNPTLNNEEKSFEDSLTAVEKQRKMKKKHLINIKKLICNKFIANDVPN